MPNRQTTALMLVAILGVFCPVYGQDGRVVLRSQAPFAKVAAALPEAIRQQGMGLVCHANAQQGAASRGVTIPGNQVLMVFRNDFAIRIINADPRAAFEAPIRIYVYENADGTATVTYAEPSALFAPYGNPEVDKIGQELDPIFKRIAEQAASVR